MNAIVIYWSQTGNTESMANRISNDLNVKCVNVSEISASDAISYDTLILGCPAMGAEELEEYEFRPFFNELINKITNQRLFLFGSFGWGGGEWMRNWEEEVKSLGKTLGSSGLISNGDESEIDPSEYENFINSIKG